MPETIRFKFKYLDDQGNETGFLSKKGSFDGERLELDSEEIPAVAILRATRRFNRIILALLQENRRRGQASPQAWAAFVAAGRGVMP